MRHRHSFPVPLGQLLFEGNFVTRSYSHGGYYFLPNSIKQPVHVVPPALKVSNEPPHATQSRRLADSH